MTLGTPFPGATRPLGLPGCILNRARAQELATNWRVVVDLSAGRSHVEVAGVDGAQDARVPYHLRTPHRR